MVSTKRFLSFFLAAGFLAAGVLSQSGCGYTTKSLMAADVRSIHVLPVKNVIDLASELSGNDRFRAYRPGLEVDVTNSIINRFIFDGNLKVVSSEKADAVMEVTLVDYRRDPLRYSDSDDIQEYRLSVTVDAGLYRNNAAHEGFWKERITGDTTFYLSGSRAISEDQAAAQAVEDLTRRVVERTIEHW